MATNAEFYQNIPAFSDFSSLSEDRNFHKVPSTWFVVLTDIKGSTKAIQEGRYKEVNMLGAACITCVTNVLGTMDFPFVFGGDGATLLISPEHLEAISSELIQLKALSEEKFKLELRVGLVPMAEIFRQGFDLMVGKYELSPGHSIAQFKGGGLTLAEDMIKKELIGSKILKRQKSFKGPKLNGLSCRISPIQSMKGTILTILVKPTDGRNGNEVIKQVLDEFRRRLGHDLRLASPVTQKNLIWRWPPKTMGMESLFLGHLVGTAFRSLISWFLLTFNINIGGFRPKKYKTELVQNSDFKKFDETLRMVIDCQVDQADKIESFLSSLQDKGIVHYGVHRSTHALLTCIVKSASDSNGHLHFVDGAEGGYAFAALQIKAQVKVEAH